METQPYELTRNPVDGTHGFICREHGINRSGLTGPHALNTEKKHIRDHHAEGPDIILNLTAMASFVMSWQEPGTPTGAAVFRAWVQLTDLDDDAARELAAKLATEDAPLVQCIPVPF